MITGYNVIDENGNEIKIDIIMQFRIEELGKEYIVFTVNDDGTSKVKWQIKAADGTYLIGSEYIFFKKKISYFWI